MGARHDAIKVMERAQIARYRADECLKTIDRRRVIRLSGGRTVRLAAAAMEGDALRLEVSVIDRGQDVTPDGFNPWYILNPPLLVPDPAGDVVLETKTPQGETITATYSEDPYAALEQIIIRQFS